MADSLNEQTKLLLKEIPDTREEPVISSIVCIRADSDFYDNHISNPGYSVEIVTENSKREYLNYTVKWFNSTRNAYSKKDLKVIIK